jgi:hypothetical protein
MAGETSPGPAAPPSPREAPKVRTLACPHCGGPLTVRGLLQTETIACGGCGSVLDLSDDSLRVLSTFRARARIEPSVPLGSRGKLLGDTLEVIGFLRRKVNVEGIDYEWSEYLLFNPYKGFRWLSDYNGHWTFIRTLLERPDGLYVVSYQGRTFKHFQRAKAEVTYVLGEFFWRVKVGESALVDDYVSPPYLLSREQSENEIVWSLGQYVLPEVVQSAFRLEGRLPAPIGVYSCQPDPYAASARPIYRLCAGFLAGALILQILMIFLAKNQLVYRGDFQYSPSSGEKSFVTDVFEVLGHTSNVVVRTHANLSNSWLYLNLALIDESSGHAYDFGREISYYFGRDSDGSWSEGSPDDEATLPAIPAGRYYLRVEPENGGDPISYSIGVYRDVPRWKFFVLAALALLTVPGYLFWRQRYFEIQRWAESDHPIVTVSSDD